LHYQDEYPTAIIAMRVGDFYEIYGDAAIDVSERLELTLTSRDFGLKERVKMVGFPYHRIDVYREKIRDFASVAFVENEEDIRIYFRKDNGTPSLAVNTQTGEVIEEKRSPAVDDLIGILFGIMKQDLEDKRL
jgi:DNA mismatch repair ATPase MutS